MPVISKARTALWATLVLGAFACNGALLPGCASHKQSTVARGKYYSSGDPHYDEFFIMLYVLQVDLELAPRVPEAERRELAQALKLPPTATANAIGDGLREAALELSRAGVRLRLDPHPSSEDPSVSRTELRSNARPKDAAAVALLARVEASGSHLLRSVAEMNHDLETLSKVEVMTIALDQGVDRAFAQASVGKLSEVKKNLADGHKLISLMRARGESVRASSEQLLATITRALNTDDGSLGAAGGEQKPAEPAPAEPSEPAAKKPAAKPRPKAGPSAGPAAARPKPAAPAARPKPATEVEGEAPAAPKPASKPPAAPRDFEP